MVAGTIIGASIFVQPSEIARHLTTPVEIMLVWLACGVLTLFGALVCAELASAFPQTGGLYVFLRDTFSPLAGFLWGWAMFWSMHSGIIAAIAVVFARYTGHFVPMDETGIRAVAVAVIVALSALNYTGVKAGTRVQTALTIAKIAAIGAVVAIGLGFAATRPGDTGLAEGFALEGNASFSDFLLAMVAGLFAYGGWHMVTYTAGETIMPARTIPAALISGVAIVTICYAALNLLYLAVLPLEAVRSSTRVAADAADAVLGGGGSGVMAALVMISAFGGLTGIVLTGPRVYFSMANDGLTFEWLGDDDDGHGRGDRHRDDIDGWALYVAEAGKGGTSPCAMVRGALQCAGATGAVSRLYEGRQRRIARNLPSYAPSSGIGATGPHDVSYAWGSGYVSVGLGGPLSPVEMRGLFGLSPAGNVRIGGGMTRL